VVSERSAWRRLPTPTRLAIRGVYGPGARRVPAAAILSGALRANRVRWFGWFAWNDWCGVPVIAVHPGKNGDLKFYADRSLSANQARAEARRLRKTQAKSFASGQALFDHFAAPEGKAGLAIITAIAARGAVLVIPSANRKKTTKRQVLLLWRRSQTIDPDLSKTDRVRWVADHVFRHETAVWRAIRDLS
jgi:hypothetical protein